MKLEYAERVMSIASLEFLQAPHLVKYAGLFDKAMLWLVANPEGKCAVDFCAGNMRQKELNVRFVVGECSPSLIIKGVRLHLLDQQIEGKKVSFAFQSFARMNSEQRLSFDWISGRGEPQWPVIPIEAILQLDGTEFEIVNTFYVQERETI
jgi:hypothetical protein